MQKLIDVQEAKEFASTFLADPILKMAVNAVLDNAPAVTDTNVGGKWIPVTERLPQREGRYLCVKRIGKSGAVYFQLMNGDSYGFSMKHIYTDDVTHWMPLPEPPGEV